MREKQYKCLCCRDTGIVFDPRITRPTYDIAIDVPLMCTRCDAKQQLGATQKYLYKMPLAECQAIHDYCRGVTA